MAAVEETPGEFSPRIKISEAPEKITNPGRKSVYRIYNDDGHAIADLIASFDEKVDVKSPFRYVDPIKPWKNRSFENCTARCLQELVVKEGKRVNPERPLREIQKYVREQLDNEIWPEEQRFENPHTHYLDMSPDYYALKMDLLHDSH